MAALTATLALVAGTATQVIGQQKAAKASEQSEALRRRQMQLEARRQRRNNIREALIQQGAALAAAGGAGAVGGSGIQGVIGGISSEANRANVASLQGEQIGSGIFAANADIASAGAITAAGSGLSSLGGAALQNYDTISKIATNFSGTA